MHKTGKTAIILSLLLTILASSTLSVCSVAENYRWTWDSLNPWNGFESIAFLISYFLHTDYGLSYLFAFFVLCLIGGVFFMFFFYAMKAVEWICRKK